MGARKNAFPTREAVYCAIHCTHRTGAHILDLGCGSGTITRYLLDRAYRVTGVDSSSEMLRLARTHCPEAHFVSGDMTAVDLTDCYQGFAAWDSVFHIPRTDHEKRFGLMSGWLEPNAPMLLSVGESDEFTSPMFKIDFITVPTLQP